MLAPNPKFLERKAPHSEGYEAPAKAPQGEAWRPNPVAIEPSWPVVRGSARDGGKEGPTWRTARIAKFGAAIMTLTDKAGARCASGLVWFTS